MGGYPGTRESVHFSANAVAGMCSSTRVPGYPCDPFGRRSAGPTPQRPVNSGFCLATNAATAAAWSSVAPVAFIICRSSSRESATLWAAE